MNLELFCNFGGVGQNECGLDQAVAVESELEKVFGCDRLVSKVFAWTFDIHVNNVSDFSEVLEIWLFGEFHFLLSPTEDTQKLKVRIPSLSCFNM